VTTATVRVQGRCEAYRQRGGAPAQRVRHSAVAQSIVGDRRCRSCYSAQAEISDGPILIGPGRGAPTSEQGRIFQLKGCLRMTLREILSGTSSWLRSHRYAENGRCAPVLADDGLLAADRDLEDEFGDVGGPAGEPVMGGPITAVERRESIERLQDGFNQLVDQLQQINDHLSRQVAQHEDLMARVKQLPPLLESLPSAVENQKHLTGQLLAHLQNTVARERQFSEAVERMPAEAARQTDTLVDINHQLAAAADIDVQMAESFN
jgi:hypothetical protein